MILLISWVLLVIAIVVLILSTILLIECLSATLNVRSRTTTVQQEDHWQTTPIVILMPAHNEELVIGQTLKTIVPQLKSIDRIVVIADNCDDQTAEIATEMGVIVVERKDEINKGKGYALDFGLQQLRDNPPEVVIFIDADSLVDLQAIQILTNKAIATNKPIQGLYLMEKPDQPSPKDYISAFAFKVKNLVRPLGLYNLHQPCLLTGTGMAFPWQAINSVDNLASGEIVEDMKLGIDLAIVGNAPIFCQEAKITGILPQKQQASTTQRTRWEHGHLQNLLTYVPTSGSPSSSSDSTSSTRARPPPEEKRSERCQRGAWVLESTLVNACSFSISWFGGRSVSSSPRALSVRRNVSGAP